jgi:hypothetical protein
MSALEETLADGKASSIKKSGGGLKVGSNSHLLLKVSLCWRLDTFVISYVLVVSHLCDVL